MLMEFCPKGLVVSLPGSAMLRLQTPGTLFSVHDLDALVLPPDLRVATRLVAEAATAAGRPLRFIARPEMYTHGALSEGLHAQLGGIADHLALSDGHSCRLLPGLRNHLFFYRRTRPEAVDALRALVARSPEIFCQLETQVNGALGFRKDGRWWRPRLSVARFSVTPRFHQARALPFFMHPSNPERAARLSLQAAETEGAAGEPDGSPFPSASWLHVPLSAAVLADAPFMRWLAERLLAAILRDEQQILLELPPSSGDDEEVCGLIVAALRALAATGVTFPRVMTRLMGWSTAAPPAEAMAGARLLLHPGVDFWRIGEDIWRALAEVQVVQEGPAGAPFTAMLRSWLGDLAPLRPLRPQPPPHHVKVASVV